MLTHIYSQTHIHMLTHTYTLIHTNKHTHTNTLLYAYKHSHMQMQTQISFSSHKFVSRMVNGGLTGRWLGAPAAPATLAAVVYTVCLT